jgi:DNA-binding MarR family transcriptional regulator
MTLEKPLGYLLWQTKRVYRNRLIAKLKEVNIDFALEHFVILHQISLKDDLTQQDLANHLQKDKSIILRQINLLIDKNYVRRLTHEDDKRKKILVLTKEGLAILASTKEIAKSVSSELLSGVNNKDVDVFLTVLNKIRENGGPVEDFLQE